MLRRLESKTTFWFNMTAGVDSGNSSEEIPIRVELTSLIDVLFEGKSDEEKERAKQKMIELGLNALEKERP